MQRFHVASVRNSTDLSRYFRWRVNNTPTTFAKGGLVEFAAGEYLINDRVDTEVRQLDKKLFKLLVEG